MIMIPIFGIPSCFLTLAKTSQRSMPKQMIVQPSQKEQLNMAASESSISMMRPSRDAYLERKGIELLNCSGVRTEFPNTEVYDLAPDLVEALDWTDLEKSRWKHLFGPRLYAAVNGSAIRNKNLILPESFSGTTPTGLNAGTTQYDRFKRIIELQSKVEPTEWKWKTGAVSRTSADCEWPWLHIEKPFISALNPDLMYSWHNNSSASQRLLADRLLEFAKRTNFSPEIINSVLELVHCEWAKTLNSFYDHSSLLFCSEILKQQLTERSLTAEETLELLFEMEYFAFYSSLANRYKNLYAGEFEGYWLEIVDLPLSRLKPTELCQTGRLFDELVNLYQGRTAPVIVNEYESIADGNHRLTASWLWNLLRASAKEDWSIRSDHFQTALARFFEEHKEIISPVTVHEVARHLAAILEDSSKFKFLENQIKPWMLSSKPSKRIDSIPAVVLTTYNSLAAIAEPYDLNQEIIRFEPGIYEALVNLHCKVLPARACYHFADRVPLPWFALVGPNSHKPSDSN